MRKLTLAETFLAVIISLGIIGGAVYRFDFCKVDREAFAQLEAGFDVYKLEQYRRSLQQRVWDIKKNYPNTYKNKREYQELVESLRQLDLKIKTYYLKKG